MRGFFRFIFGLIGFALVILVLTAVWIVYDGLRDQGDRTEIGVVPGAATGGRAGGIPTDALDAAVRLYNSGRFPLIYVSGMKSQGYDEAAAMAKYLEAHAVPHDAIVVDHDGVNTAATAHDLARAMKWRDFHTALIITQYYHVTRMKLALAEAGVSETAQYHVGALRQEDALPIAREAVAFHYYWMRFYLLPEAKVLEAKAEEDAPKVKAEIQQDTQKAKDAVQKKIDSLPK